MDEKSVTKFSQVKRKLNVETMPNPWAHSLVTCGKNRVSEKMESGNKKNSLTSHLFNVCLYPSRYT